MSALNHDLARALHNDRLAEMDRIPRRRQTRLTRPAAKRPEPAGQPRPGLLARLIPWFGVRINPAY